MTSVNATVLVVMLEPPNPREGTETQVQLLSR